MTMPHSIFTSGGSNHAKWARINKHWQRKHGVSVECNFNTKENKAKSRSNNRSNNNSISNHNSNNKNKNRNDNNNNYNWKKVGWIEGEKSKDCKISHEYSHDRRAISDLAAVVVDERDEERLLRDGEVEECHWWDLKELERAEKETMKARRRERKRSRKADAKGAFTRYCFSLRPFPVPLRHGLWCPRCWQIHEHPNNVSAVAHVRSTHSCLKFNRRGEGENEGISPVLIDGSFFGHAFVGAFAERYPFLFPSKHENNKVEEESSCGEGRERLSRFEVRNPCALILPSSISHTFRISFFYHLSLLIFINKFIL